jgi:hypothetical protein
MNRLENINIFNYEAFYLDYLEGNLSFEESELLWAFLNANPQFILEDETLPLLDLEEAVSFNFKNTLKKTDLIQDEINVENVEEFIVADIEFQLSNEQRNNLNSFLLHHPIWQEEADVYAKTRLSLEHFSFPDKQQLKKRANSKSWIIYAAAAIFMGVIFMLMPNNGGPELNRNQNSTLVSSKQKTKKSTDLKIENTIVLAKKGEDDAGFKQALPPDAIVLENNEIIDREIGTLPFKRMAIIDQSNARELITTTIAFNDTKREEVIDRENEIVSYTAFNNTEPITHELSKIFDRQIELKKIENHDKEREGFFVKFGKFEIYHRKSKKTIK